jgi:hypothetical protein
MFMALPAELVGIQGAQALYDWFGYWPDFHDGEILSLHVNRSGSSSILVHTWGYTGQTDERGYHITEKHVVVEFVLAGILGLNLEGFSHQNVVAGADIQKTDGGFLLTLYPCYGLSGAVEAAQIAIRLSPGEPP